MLAPVNKLSTLPLITPETCEHINNRKKIWPKTRALLEMKPNIINGQIKAQMILTGLLTIGLSCTLLYNSLLNNVSIPISYH
jgi:hypothetical protein